MATQEADVQIQDEEEYVDKRVKQRILDARQQVDDMEKALFDEELLSPDVNIGHSRKVLAWGNTVRRFLRNIEVILLRIDLSAAGGERGDPSERYLHDVDLGAVTLVPPDKRGFQFSKVAHPDVSDADLKRMLDLPSSADIPKPTDVPFEGLQSIVSSDSLLAESWHVSLGRGNPAERQTIELHAERPVPKSIYEDAIRAADRFLHDANIGINIKAQDHYSEEPGL